MKIQETPDYLIFADESKTDELYQFPNILRGWGITLEQTQGKPPMEWMNGVFNRIDKNALYLLQQGVPEWNASVLYPINAIIKYKGVLYLAIVQNDGAIPSTNTTKWTKIIQDASLIQKGVVKLNSSTDSESETEAATPKAVKAVKNALSGYLPATKGDDGYKVNDDINFQKTPKVNDIELVYLVESYRSGYSWYEKYSNGVVRQGGVAQMNQASSQTVVHTTVNILVPVIDTDYNVTLTSANSSGNWGNTLHTFSAQSKTSFIISSYCQVTNSQLSQIYWETRGFFK